MSSFDFATAGRILFGEGKVVEVASIALELGRRALICCGNRSSGHRLFPLLEENRVAVEILDVRGEPGVEFVRQGAQRAREANCDLVIGLGGGSALDAAKAIAALMTNPGDPLDYLEVVGRSLPLRERPAPFLAVPTTAGTGSEVTRNAVLTAVETGPVDGSRGMKVSLRSPWLLARAAIIDPQLTYSLPPAISAATGMDALAQVIEPYVSARANPMADLYCRDGIARAARSLPKVYQDGQDVLARRNMAFASLMGGLALANAGLGAVHGFASPIGGMFDAPHGAVCAALLPPVVAANAQALRSRCPEHPALERYRQIAEWVTGASGASVEDLAAWLNALRESLHIPGLSSYGIRSEHIAGLVEKGAIASSMKANPIQLTPEELAWILENAL